jgi:hypothetical protein
MRRKECARDTHYREECSPRVYYLAVGRYEGVLAALDPPNVLILPLHEHTILDAKEFMI